MAVGDEIAAINNREVKSWGDVVSAVRAQPGQALTVEVRRDGARIPAIPVTDAAS